MFEPHGSFKIEVMDNILICHLLDTWDRKEVEIYIDAMKKLVEDWGYSHWCRIIDMQEFALSVPEADDILKDFIDWANNHGCQSHLYVTNSSLHRMQIEKVRPPGSSSQIFTHLPAAIDEAHSLLRNSKGPDL